MCGAKHNYPRREKLVFIIGLGLERECLTYKDIIECFDCTRRTANRLLNQIYDMQYELKYITVEKLCKGTSYEPIKIKIRISRLFKNTDR